MTGWRQRAQTEMQGVSFRDKKKLFLPSGRSQFAQRGFGVSISKGTVADCPSWCTDYLLTYTVEEDSWPQGAVSPQGVMKTEQSFGKVHALIWTQAAVHASQQKSPQEQHATELLARERADLLDTVIIPYCTAQMKKSERPSEVIYKQNFSKNTQTPHRGHLGEADNASKSPCLSMGCPTEGRGTGTDRAQPPKHNN